MIEFISTQLVRILCNGTYLSSEQYDALNYGMETLVYTVLSTLALVMIGFLFMQPLNACIIIAVFYLNQTIGGGFHANSHMKCFITMAFFLMLGLAINYLHLPAKSYAILSVFAFIILMMCPLTLHKNKQYLGEQSARLILRSRLITTMQMMMYIAICIGLRSMHMAFSIGVVFSALSRLFAVLTRRQQLYHMIK